MSNYESLDGVRQSDLKRILIGPEFFKLNNKITSDALRFGTAFHRLLLEPQKAHSIIVDENVSGRSRKAELFKQIIDVKDLSFFKVTDKKKIKQAYEVTEQEYTYLEEIHDKYNKIENPIFIDAEEKLKIEKMIQSVRKNKFCNKVLNDPYESEMIKNFIYKGIKFKSQIDLYSNTHGVIIDFKTTRLQPEKSHLYNEIYNRLYHFQAFSYLQACGAYESFDYVIVFVRNEEPHVTIPIKLGPIVLQKGKALFDKACDDFVFCRDFNPEFQTDYDVIVME